jgi:hypothetical protein
MLNQIKKLKPTQEILATTNFICVMVSLQKEGTEM